MKSTLPSSQAADFEGDFKGISRSGYVREKFAPVDLQFGEFVKGDFEKVGPKTANIGHGVPEHFSDKGSTCRK